ncbi:drug/metabolite transporter (DMT)-like permease [Angulomicrobium tetraedrale]|uniref:Drug/metabolite transporter (DMT)-like permease n=1 Tax=Ancylobacter tetraedralis TaxID=217068 RepID=A0A839ZCA5_9HYPH|nr:hypothetical protein [Ancylobacter tetraedralis]MBB3772403.1 drug/metabolite transporter (DMT)-like permease [Ancylobacter tetraedralis]
MMLRFITARAGHESPPWPWPARVPAIILAYGAAILAVLVTERLMHSATSAYYAAIAVVPGGIAAGVAAFALSFTPRARLTVLAAVIIVALLPLAVIALSIDFHEYRALFQQRALLLGAIFAAIIAFVTGVLLVGGVFPSRGAAR